jgi:hypothetical protein
MFGVCTDLAIKLAALLLDWSLMLGKGLSLDSLMLEDEGMSDIGVLMVEMLLVAKIAVLHSS